MVTEIILTLIVASLVLGFHAVIIQKASLEFTPPYGLMDSDDYVKVCRKQLRVLATILMVGIAICGILASQVSTFVGVFV